MEVNYWQYYLSLEEDIDRIFRYIEPSEHNFLVFSVELTRLYLAICSEVDVILKAYCSLLKNECKASNINEYAEIVASLNKGIATQTALLQRSEILFTPFSEWENQLPLTWWKKHNGVKHNRGMNFKDANLGNVLTAFSALYLVNLNYCNELRSIELRDQGFFTSLEQTAASLKSRIDVLKLDSVWLGFYES